MDRPVPDWRADAERDPRTRSAAPNNSPGWTVPEPASAYDDTRKGDTKDLPAKDDPELDWVQELKPVEPGATLTEPKAEPEAETKKPARRAKKTTRTRRKLASDEPTPEDPA